MMPCRGKDHDRSYIHRCAARRQKSGLLRRCPGAAWLQMHKGCEVAGRLRIRGRQHLVLGCFRQAPGSTDEKSGLHFCFAAPDAAAVDAFHAAALRSGGRDNGAPGLRPVYGADYYAAFIIDPDGYRIEAYYGPGER